MELTALIGLIFGNEVFGYIEAFFALLGAASMVARLTPTDADNKVVNKVYGFVHKVGLTLPDKKGGFVRVGVLIIMCLLLVTSFVCTGCGPFTKYKAQVADTCAKAETGINQVQEIAEVACAMDVVPQGICNTAQVGYAEIAPVLEGICHGAGADTELNKWE
jgi:hypothetical protein